MNIGDCLRLSALRWPEKTALKDENRSVTYRNLDTRANQIVHVLQAMGLQKGDSCAVILHNCIESIEIFFGLARSGVIGVPINFRNNTHEIEFLYTHSNSKAFFVGADLIEKVVPLIGTVVDPASVLIVGKTLPEYKSYHELVSLSPGIRPKIPIEENHVCYIGYTSGTTDLPKGVPTRHRALLENATQWLVDYGNYNEDDKFMLVMPLFHANAIMCSLLMIIVGGTLYIYHSKAFDPEEMLQIVDQENITITSVVPTMLNLILELSPQKSGKFHRKSIHTILVASSPLWTTIKEGTLRYFPNTKLYEGYGSTEHQIVTVLKPTYQWGKIRSIGKPVIYKEVRLFNDQGFEVSVGEPGELYVRGWGIPLQNYYNNEAATLAAYRGGWSTVGDIAIQDEEGFFYLIDRKKDMIISGGENISPSEIENIIAQHPWVSEVAVIGQPDQKWGEAVTAVIVVRSGMKASPEDIKRFCEDKMARYKIPKYFDFTEELPKNPTGKILRRIVRNRYWQEKQIKI